MQAKDTVLPAYPPSAFKAGHEGLAVAEVLVNTNGSIASIRLIEAPDPQIGESVVTAVKQWSFHVVTDREYVPIRFKGRVLYYFRRQNNKPVVIDAVAEAIAVATKK